MSATFKFLSFVKPKSNLGGKNFAVKEHYGKKGFLTLPPPPPIFPNSTSSIFLCRALGIRLILGIKKGKQPESTLIFKKWQQRKG